MNGKIGLIIRREYLSRVRKRSFIIMTILGPLLLAGLMIVPVWLAQKGQSNRVIAVLDKTDILSQGLKNKETIRFVYVRGSADSLIQKLPDSAFDALLYIPETAQENLKNGLNSAKLYSRTNISLSTKVFIESQIEKQLQRALLAGMDIHPDTVESVERISKVNLKVLNVDELNKPGDAFLEVKTVVAFVGGMLIYIFIFLFGSMVMRGVIEEKTNRVVELMISSVKPFQLMMGKIVGIALVGLTQFTLWIVLTGAIYLTIQSQVWEKKYTPNQIENLVNQLPEGADTENLEALKGMSAVMEGINAVNWPLMLGVFLFYFMGGYLFYGAFFAAIGSAVDNESDTQQMMLPVTVPLILSFVMAQSVIEDPTSTMATWLSMIPFTSPIIMLIRLPFQVHIAELIASMSLLALSFVGSTWVAAKIYRVGILMYGKKPTYKELWKWLRY